MSVDTLHIPIGDDDLSDILANPPPCPVCDNPMPQHLFDGHFCLFCGYEEALPDTGSEPGKQLHGDPILDDRTARGREAA